MPLTDLRIRKIKPAEKIRKYADGEGLTLIVMPNGSKLWRFRYRHFGKHREMAIGRYPYISLSDARAARYDAKSTLAKGLDPVGEYRKAQAREQAITADIFSNVATELLEKFEREGKAVATMHKKRWLIDMATRDFGNVPVRNLSSALILKTLRKVEAKEHYETARRLRSTIGQVCRYAIATARLDNDPTQALSGALTNHKVSHQPAITDEIAFLNLVQDIWGYWGSASVTAGLKLMVLLYPRPGELRQARWSDFDFDKAIWTIPAEIEKNRLQHVKPLPALAIDILDKHRISAGAGEFVFPMLSNPRRPISANAFNQALHKLGYKGVQTSHGLRASASSLLNESGLWHEDAIEKELGHKIGNQSRRPYNRAAYWDQRIAMTEWWSTFSTKSIT